MSSYLQIFKNGVEVGWWSRSERLYRVLGEFAPYDSECVVDLGEAIKTAHMQLVDEEKEIEQNISELKDSLNYLKSPEDIKDAIHSISELENEISGINGDRAILQFLAKNFHCDSDATWTWRIG